MKRYILGFFTAAAAAAALWLLHRTFPCPLTALLTPVNGSPWEMGKLLYWPYLPAVLVRRLRGGELLWYVLAILLGIAYLLLTVRAPSAGPFADPSAPAMAAIPF